MIDDEKIYKDSVLWNNDNTQMCFQSVLFPSNQ